MEFKKRMIIEGNFRGGRLSREISGKDTIIEGIIIGQGDSAEKKTTLMRIHFTIHIRICY